MTTLECKCGFTIDDGLDLGIIMFVEHRKSCKVWEDQFKKLLKESKE